MKEETDLFLFRELEKMNNECELQSNKANKPTNSQIWQSLKLSMISLLGTPIY